MTAQRITPATAQALFGCAATRAIEQAALAGLPPGTLMQRAGLAVARLAAAVAPHARRIWIAWRRRNPDSKSSFTLWSSARRRSWPPRWKPSIRWFPRILPFRMRYLRRMFRSPKESRSTRICGRKRQHRLRHNSYK